MAGHIFSQLKIAGEEGAEHIDGRVYPAGDEVGCMGFVPGECQ